MPGNPAIMEQVGRRGKAAAAPKAAEAAIPPQAPGIPTPDMAKVPDVVDKKPPDVAKGKPSINKSDLAAAGIQAAGGLASGIAEGLLMDEDSPEGKSAIPSGSVGGVGRSATPGSLHVGRPQIGAQDRQSLALEMLRRG